MRPVISQCSFIKSSTLKTPTAAAILLLVGVRRTSAQLLKKAAPGRLFVLAFEEAASSWYPMAVPLLKQYGFGATFFICACGLKYFFNK